MALNMYIGTPRPPALEDYAHLLNGPTYDIIEAMREKNIRIGPEQWPVMENDEIEEKVKIDFLIQYFFKTELDRYNRGDMKFQIFMAPDNKQAIRMAKKMKLKDASVCKTIWTAY